MVKCRVSSIEGHTEGMPVRMIVSGAPELTGTSMDEKRHYFVSHFDWFRRALMLEPRGHGHMSGTIFYPAISENADFSLLFIETSGCLPMCGHATLGSISFAIEQGLMKPKQQGQVIVDVPAGQIKADYQLTDGKVKSVKFTNVPAFLLHQDLEIELSTLGKLKLDIAYGGNFYPIIDVQENYPGCEYFSPDELLKWGIEVQQQINQQFSIVHPENPNIKGVKHCMWTGKPLTTTAHGRSVVIAGHDLVDRSPCGTGTSARVAQRYARGWLTANTPFIHESIIASRFIGRVEQVTQLANGQLAVYPSIEGRAWITGEANYYIDDSQGWWDGFSLNDFINPNKTNK